MSRRKEFAFLDRLRDSGETNMFGAAVFLRFEFNLGPHEARKILLEWMSETTQTEDEHEDAR